MTLGFLSKPALCFGLMGLLIFGGMFGCTYGKSYFRIGPDGKMIKAPGPIVPGEGTAGTATGGAGTAGTATSGTGGTGIISPTGGSGTGGAATAGTTGGGITGTSLYPLIIQTKDDTTSLTNLYLARFSGSAFLEAPKQVTQITDKSFSILFPALSPDASSVIYMALWDDSVTHQPKAEDQVITNLATTPQEATWNAADPGVSHSWRANGQDVVYVAGGCGLIRKAASDGSNPTTDANAPSGTYDKWIYFQTSVSPVTDTSNPTYDLLVFSMFSADKNVTNQGFDLFVKKLGDADATHIANLTQTPTMLEFYPSISPDGKSVLFSVGDSTAQNSGPQKIAVCDLTNAGGTFQCANTRTLDTFAADAVSTSPCWSWDGTKIFFVSKDSTHKDSDVYMVDFTGGAFGSPVDITNTDKADDMEISCASAPATLPH